MNEFLNANRLRNIGQKSITFYKGILSVIDCQMFDYRELLNLALEFSSNMF